VVTPRSSGGRDFRAWSWCRTAVTVVMLLCGGGVAFFSLGIRAYASGYWWGSNRYSNWGWQFADAALAFMAGTVLFPRAAWLAMTALARFGGYELVGGRLRTLDFWALAVPSVLLAYLIYVANVRNMSFWPIGLALVGVYVVMKRVLAARGEKPTLTLGHRDRSHE
jgi:hypothetical protein